MVAKPLCTQVGTWRERFGLSVSEVCKSIMLWNSLLSPIVGQSARCPSKCCCIINLKFCAKKGWINCLWRFLGCFTTGFGVLMGSDISGYYCYHMIRRTKGRNLSEFKTRMVAQMVSDILLLFDNAIIDMTVVWIIFHCHSSNIKLQPHIL